MIDRIRVVATGWLVLLALALPLVTGADSAPDLTAIARDTEARVNAEREKQSLQPYESSGTLAEMAREHAERIASGEIEFGHDGFGDRQAKIFAKLGANHAAENVGWNNKTAEGAAAEAVAKWMRSPEHRGHILGSFRQAGVGVARSPAGTWYFTLLLAGPWPLPEG